MNEYSKIRKTVEHKKRQYKTQSNLNSPMNMEHSNYPVYVVQAHFTLKVNF